MRIRVTRRQKEVLELVREGKTQKQIGEILECSSSNISQIICSLQRKYPTLKIWRTKYRKYYIDYDIR